MERWRLIYLMRNNLLSALWSLLWFLVGSLLIVFLLMGCALMEPNEQVIQYTEVDGEPTLTQYSRTHWGGGAQQDVRVDIQQEDADRWSLLIEMKAAHDPSAQQNIAGRFFDTLRDLGMVVVGYLAGGGG